MFRMTLLVAMGVVNASHAEPIDNVFGAGVFEVPWGASLENVQSRFPLGYTWEVTRSLPTDFVHETRIESSLFGLGTPAVLVQYGFDENEKFHVAHIFYTHDRNQDLLYQIAQVLGQDYETNPTKRETTHTWRSRSRLIVTLSIGHGRPYQWTVLTVYRATGS